MVSVEQSMVISRPVRDVFDFVADPLNNPKWRDDHISTQRTSDSPAGPGATYREIVRFVGQQEFASQIVDYEPNQRTTIQFISGPLRPRVSYTFEPLAEGTRLISRVDVQPTGLFKLMTPMMSNMIRKQWQRNFVNLRRVLEGGDSHDI
jgi:uncharacterized protein YndB with AHSA1/START domain